MPNCIIDRNALLGGIAPVQPEPRIALTKKEAAAAIGVSVDTFDRHIEAGVFIPRKPRGRGNLVLFRVDELTEALTALPTAGTIARGLVPA